MEPSTTQVAISYWYVSPASVEAKPSFPPYLLCVWDDDGVKKAQGLGARLTPLWSQAPRPPIPCSIPAAKPSFWVTPPSKEQPLIMSAFERPAPAEPVWFWPVEAWPTTPGWVIGEEDAAKRGITAAFFATYTGPLAAIEVTTFGAAHWVIQVKGGVQEAMAHLAHAKFGDPEKEFVRLGSMDNGVLVRQANVKSVRVYVVRGEEKAAKADQAARSTPEPAKKPEATPPAKPEPKCVAVGVWLKSGKSFSWRVPCPSGDPLDALKSTGWLDDMATMVAVRGLVQWGAFRKEDVVGVSVEMTLGHEEEMYA